MEPTPAADPQHASAAPPGDAQIPPPAALRVHLRLLGQFELTVAGRKVSVAGSCKRLLALLALSGGRVNRASASGVLWPDAPLGRASANLRSTLWRLQRSCADVVSASFHELAFTRGVRVDYDEAVTVARRLLDRSVPMSEDELRHAVHCNLYEDLGLDLGDDEWLAVERERYQQLRLHGLESLSEQLTDAGWHGAAVDAALGAVRADPFRESAYVLLAKAFLAEGNAPEARRHYARYRELLRRELGVEPSQDFADLVGHVPAQRGARSDRTHPAA